ncbi:hypothetical protein [Parasedimentitalea denitrificans]|uniref:hypothetical protein n=1 Tax=Parasedimentitalea denitrificans TaxID=2211118 RepID=UPI0014305D59|nr:hypothetical protein [Sedimentitalea sp. CY04]
MTAKTKFLNSIIASAQGHNVIMPWTRGAARQASIARRRSPIQSTTNSTSATAKTA